MKLLFLLLLPALASAQSLSEKLTAYLQQLPTQARVSVAFESLTDHSAFAHRADELVPSASVIKIPILIETMERVKSGQFDLEKIHMLQASEKTGGSGVLQTYPDQSKLTNREVLTLMMTRSDNTATNILIRELGMENINQRMRTLGLTQSQLNRMMMDTLAAKLGRENRVTAFEMNALLKKIYRHEVATPALCEQMIDILKRNTDQTTFRLFLPKSAVIAHKTGELSYVRGDAGIFYVSKPFLLSVFVQGTTTPEAEKIIGEIAQICYQQYL
ncbi:serine hydrolase [Larkinella terrae]|uniref:beta-lactamase n=1 Tax=Larkinella terrae TaxID=2025311 RepID=A0A7K0EJB0_9BACT|nr:serine hydrolase [Larkinella terrae]MRS61845.1 serine hydrolase [Larkinella terrae]